MLEDLLMSTRIDAHQLVIIAYYGVTCFEHKVFCFQSFWKE